MLKIRDNNDKLIGSTCKTSCFEGWLHWKTKWQEKNGFTDFCKWDVFLCFWSVILAICGSNRRRQKQGKFIKKQHSTVRINRGWRDREKGKVMLCSGGNCRKNNTQIWSDGFRVRVWLSDCTRGGQWILPTLFGRPDTQYHGCNFLRCKGHIWFGWRYYGDLWAYHQRWEFKHIP